MYCLVVNTITVDNFAFRQVRPQPLWGFRLKDLFIDERVLAWCLVFGQAHPGLIVGFLLLLFSVVCTVESLSFFYRLLISWLVWSMRWCIDKLGILNVNHTFIWSWSTSELRMRLVPLNMFKSSSDMFCWPFQDGASFVDLFCFFYVSCLSLLCCRVCSLQPCGHLLGLGLTSWLSYVLCFLVFRHFPICVLIHIRTKGWGWYRSTCLSPPVIIFTDRSRAVLLLWICFVTCLVDLLTHLCVMSSCVFVTFPYGVSGRTWYLIVLLPDLCILLLL